MERRADHVDHIALEEREARRGQRLWIDQNLGAPSVTDSLLRPLHGASGARRDEDVDRSRVVP